MTRFRSPLALTAVLLSLAVPSFATTDALAQGKTTAAPPPEKVQKAKEFGEAIIAVADKVSPSVVQIDVAIREESDAPWWLKKKSDSPLVKGNGSGVIISSDGYVLTNNHVVEDAVTIVVKTKDGKVFNAKVRGRDPSTDLAVIKVEATGLTAAKVGDSDASKVGEWVVAVGSPFGFAFSVTSGVLSAKGRGGLGMNVIEDYLQTDASINPGNSGGPLVNLNGEVIGINTMILGKYGSVGLGFAVPSNMAKKVSEQLIKNGKVVRGWLGVNVQPITPDLAKALKVDPYTGALVSDCAVNGPAAQAHLVPGDIITKVAGKPIHDDQELIREIINHDVGQPVALEVMRTGKLFTASAILAARPEPPVKPTPSEESKTNPAQGYGITMKPLPADLAQKYGFTGKGQVYVSFVDPNSAADKAGLQPGDVILESGGTPNPTIDQIKAAGGKGTLLLRVARKESRFFVAVVK
jgi:Do/DeqQ family serine protease